MSTLAVLVGTCNPSKSKELIDMLLPFSEITPMTPWEIGKENVDIRENEKSIRGNAIAKATAWAHIAHMPALAEDSGLLFPELPADHPDQPGQYVRRYHGKCLSDDEMLTHYIDIVRRHGGELTASWINCWCIAADEIHGMVYENRSRSFVLRTTACTKRHPGWPLDSISYFPEAGKYLVEMDHNELNRMEEQEERKENRKAWFRQSLALLIDDKLPAF